jgi:pSer/pThr/pTyr-binding forkhead associated (FHA) protein
VTPIHDGKFQAVIGRAGVQLAADGPGISRKHAVIVGEGGRFTLSDLGSRNGTFLNGVRCQKDEVFYVKEGDKILLGAAEVTVRLSAPRRS